MLAGASREQLLSGAAALLAGAVLFIGNSVFVRTKSPDQLGQLVGLAREEVARGEGVPYHLSDRPEGNSRS